MSPIFPPRELPVPGVVPNVTIDRNSELYKAAQEFEGIFINMMLKAMRSTVERGPINNGGFAEEIFEDMLYEERAKQMAKSAGFGLADAIYRQLAYLQTIPKSSDHTTLTN
jgi:flagellar protein FlgJ